MNWFLFEILEVRGICVIQSYGSESEKKIKSTTIYHDKGNVLIILFQILKLLFKRN